MLDPITFEVIRNFLLSTAAEMKAVVMSTGYSTVWRESGDLSCALMDPEANLIAQGPADLPGHLATMPGAMQGALQKIPAAAFEPGDVLLHNDPCWGNNHLPDFLMAKPVFADGGLMAFAVVRGHWLDVGGLSYGSYSTFTTDPLQEGITVPPVKLYRRGELNQAVVDIIMANVRGRTERMGDLRAQFAGCLTGERKLQELLGRYGAPTVEEAFREILDHSERLTRAEIAQIPDGTYTWTEHADGDGMSDNPVRIQVAVTVRGSDILADFSGTSGQTIGGMNAPYPVTYSAVQFAVRCVTDPWNPANSGCYRPMSVVAPLGSVVNPRLPASVIAGNVETASTIVDAVMGALAQAVPHRVIAAGAGTAGNVVLGGKDPRPGRDGRAFVYLESCGGCWGARPEADGINAMRYSIGNTGNGPIEVVETEYPVEIMSYGLAQDAGGAGMYRGGLPVRRVFRLGSDAVFTLAAEKSRFQPSGLFGGRPGALARYLLISGEREESLFSKTRPMPLRAGDILDIQPPGAGGYGDPLERDPALVAWDMAEGYVSREQAREAYGVVLDPAGGVDREATARLRLARGRG